MNKILIKSVLINNSRSITSFLSFIYLPSLMKIPNDLVSMNEYEYY